jgi:hypothetical protein
VEGHSNSGGDSPYRGVYAKTDRVGEGHEAPLLCLAGRIRGGKRRVASCCKLQQRSEVPSVVKHFERVWFRLLGKLSERMQDSGSKLKMDSCRQCALASMILLSVVQNIDRWRLKSCSGSLFQVQALVDKPR